MVWDVTLKTGIRANHAKPLRTGQVAARIHAGRPRLVPSALKVIELVESDPSRVLLSPVSEVAERSGTSESTVVRACQSLGFKGFHDLKLALASDLATQEREHDDLERAEGIGPRTPRREVPRLLLRNTAAVLRT